MVCFHYFQIQVEIFLFLILLFLLFPFSIFVQALGTAIASTKVMKAQQVVKGESGEEVRELPTQ